MRTQTRPRNCAQPIVSPPQTIAPPKLATRVRRFLRSLFNMMFFASVAAVPILIFCWKGTGFEDHSVVVDELSSLAYFSLANFGMGKTVLPLDFPYALCATNETAPQCAPPTAAAFGYSYTIFEAAMGITAIDLLISLAFYFWMSSLLSKLTVTKDRLEEATLSAADYTLMVRSLRLKTRGHCRLFPAAGPRHGS